MNYYTHALKKYVVFKGRASRQEFWMFFLINCLISVVLSILVVYLLSVHMYNREGTDSGDDAAGAGELIVFFFCMIILMSITNIAVGVRRLHDVNRSGWMLLVVVIIPIMLPYIPMILMLLSFSLPPGLEMNSGRYVQLLFFTPIAGFIWLMALNCIKGTEGPNKYGPDPKRAEPVLSPEENEAQ